MITMGKRYTCQLNGKTIIVRAVEVEQRMLANKRGKWVCINEATNHKVWRTARQLHPYNE